MSSFGKVSRTPYRIVYVCVYSLSIPVLALSACMLENPMNGRTENDYISIIIYNITDTADIVNIKKACLPGEIINKKRPPTAYLSKQSTGVNYAMTLAMTSLSGTKGSDQKRESNESEALSPRT